jgi:hypothetical protein
MRKRLLVFGLVGVALGASGCFVIRTEEEVVRPRPVAEPKSVTMREIDAAGKLAFEHDRHGRFKQIAQREGLSEREQLHLIAAAFSRLSFEHAKVDVLMTVVANPSFAPGARVFLLDHLDRLAFEHDKRALLDALEP